MYAGVAIKKSSRIILQKTIRGALEARAETKFARIRNKLWYHIDDAASVEAPCGGATTLEVKEDNGVLVT